MSPDGRPVTDVAVGVLLRADGQVLLADRPRGKAYAGYWEFPGGKVEPGETVEAALARELHEELGVRIGWSTPWVCFEYSYPHAYVRLHFRRVDRWSGELRAHEGQRLCFVDPCGELPVPLLPAAIPTLRWLRLPSLMAPSLVGELGLPAFLAGLDRAIGAGLRAVLVDEPGLGDEPLETAERAIALRLDAAGGAVVRLGSPGAPGEGNLANRSLGPGATHRTLPDDVVALDRGAGHTWHGTRVRDADDLRHAAASGCDFALVGPVMPSGSCADPAIGWPGFAAIVRASPLPIVAFGGLGPGDLDVARRHGAHGILLDADFWRRHSFGH